MRIIISGVEYGVGALAKASLTDLLNLKKHTGITLAQIQDGMGRLGTYENPTDALGDTEALMAMAATIWLARWKAGDKLGFEEACDFPLDELVIAPDPGDETGQGDGPDPTEAAPPVSGPAAEPDPRGRGRSRSSTSRRPSTNTSSSSPTSGPA